jgi:tetratricopeptide (TPR) repeat protein
MSQFHSTAHNTINNINPNDGLCGRCRHLGRCLRNINVQDVIMQREAVTQRINSENRFIQFEFDEKMKQRAMEIEQEKKEAEKKQANINRKKNQRAFIMDNLSIANLTPLHIENIWQLQPYKKHLQTAYEAFHHKDYETAILNYRAVLSQDPINVSALQGISVALYFINNIKGALNAMLDAADNSPDGQYLPFLKFTVHLRNRLQDEEEFFAFSVDEISEEEIATQPQEMSKSESIKITQLVH